MKKTRNATYTKEYNRRLVLSIILKKSASRSELADITGLTRAAVSIIIEELIEKKIVIEKEKISIGIGRKPIILDINADSYYSLGLNISRNSCAIGLMNIKGEILKRSDIDISGEVIAAEAIKKICLNIDTLCSEVNIDMEKLLGLGISMPGPLNVNEGTIINPPNFSIWNNVEIVNEFKKYLDYPVKLNNNSAALALAEKYYGLGSGYSDFVLMVVDTGVGSAIVLNNKLYSSVEIGHTSIDYNGNKCSCGNYGCLETYASIPCLLNELVYNRKAFSCWKDIVDGAYDNDSVCEELIKKEALYLSTGIINTVNTLEIKAIVLSGDIAYNPELLINLIYKNVNSKAIKRNEYSIDILATEIKNDADIKAAATILFDFSVFGS